MSADREILDERFAGLVPGNSALEQLWTGARWCEGPVYFGDGDYLLFSDIPNNRMLRWTPDGPANGQVGVFRAPSDYTNGNTRDREGRLVSCQHGKRRVIRTEVDGSITVIADSYDGKPLNSPNDVVVKSDGSIWFTDPPYGILSDHEGQVAEQEQSGCFVYRLDPDSGELAVVADDFDKPNGLAFSPDERLLYVSDTGSSHDPDGPHHIRRFDVVDGKKLANGKLFKEIEQGVADGFRADRQGNIWTSTAIGVQCFAPEGDLLGEIRLDEMVSNLTFGGPKNNLLLITATTSVYAVHVAVTGAK